MKKSTKIWIGVGLGVLTLGTAAFFIFRNKEDEATEDVIVDGDTRSVNDTVGGTTVGSVGNVQAIEAVVNIPVVNRPIVVPSSGGLGSTTVVHATGFTAKIISNTVRSIGLIGVASGDITLDKDIPISISSPIPFPVTIYSRKYGRIRTMGTNAIGQTLYNRRIRLMSVNKIKSPNDLNGATIEIKG